MLIVANWKAYVQSAAKAKALFASAKRLAAVSGTSGTKIVLAPPAPYIGFLAAGNRSKVAFASQDLSIGDGGAATGEIPAKLLADLGVSYAILGHSERRTLGETDAMVSDKVRRALGSKLTPIVCIGERSRDDDAKYLNFLRSQISEVFKPLSPKERSQVVLAYEPIWAIGKSAAEAIQPHDLTEMILYIRKVLSEYLPGTAAGKVQILYGGSVEPEGVLALAEGTGVNGFLIGHASVDVAVFSALVKALPSKKSR
jgi:triosephosphate isomerase